MINLSDLTEEDIGKEVLYSATPGSKPESGIISGYNSMFIFVAFSNTPKGGVQACSASGLTFL